MGNKRFSATTLVMVGLALIALYFVGTKVTPPPAGPPVEQKPTAAVQPPPGPSAPSAAELKVSSSRMSADNKNAQDRMKKIQEMQAEAKKHPTPAAKPFNPASIETEADYWHKNKMGTQGEQEMRAKVAAAEAEAKKVPAMPVTSEKATSKANMPKATPVMDERHLEGEKK